MIFADRSQEPRPAVLETKRSDWADELEALKAFYRDKANHQKACTLFKVYKHRTVVDAIERLFHKKCAYCESTYKNLHPVDVEHYRPKGKVIVRVHGKEVLREFGYWWLAGDWDNLLPSCIDCNRERTQELLDPKTKAKTGKGNKFPLEPRSRWATRPTGVADERPLLLQPCKDNPDLHLTFLEDGGVKPAVLPDGTLSLKGLTSIEVFGLNRRGLVEVRRDLATEVLAQIKKLREYEDRLDRDPDDPDVIRWYTEEARALAARTRPDRPFASMVRQLIRRHYPAATQVRPGRRSRSRLAARVR